jgi:hypothetical protein
MQAGQEDEVLKPDIVWRFPNLSKKNKKFDFRVGVVVELTEILYDQW